MMKKKIFFFVCFKMMKVTVTVNKEHLSGCEKRKKRKEFLLT